MLNKNGIICRYGMLDGWVLTTKSGEKFRLINKMALKGQPEWGWFQMLKAEDMYHVVRRVLDNKET